MKSPVFTVINGDEDGAITHISMPDTCVAIFKDANERILLLRQFRPILGAFLLEIPGGSQRAGETPLEAAAREFKEETGMAATTLHSLISVVLSVGASDEWVHIYRVTAVKGTRFEPEEPGIQIRWVDHRESLRMIERGEIVDAKTVIALQMLR